MQIDIMFVLFKEVFVFVRVHARKCSMETVQLVFACENNSHKR